MPPSTHRTSRRAILLTRKVPPPPEAKPLLTALVQVSRAEGQPAGGIR
jgi:hypothetical protein